MKVAYVAHPLGAGPDREKNRRNAAKWCAWLAKKYGFAPIADWIVLSGVWDESERDLGLKIDFALIERCDQFFLVGGRTSPGMKLELEHFSSVTPGGDVFDLTDLGYEPPED